MGISWEYLGNILMISLGYLWDILRISRVISWGIYFLQFQFKKNYFLNFGQILKCAWDSGDGDGDGDCDRHGEF